MVIFGYGFEIPIPDEMFRDLETGERIIAEIPFTEDDIFKGDLVRFSPESNPKIYSDYEIVGQVEPVEDENGKFYKKLLHVEKIVPYVEGIN